jgi:hypothetical protein
VVRFSDLRKRETDAGREEGVKDRPCAAVIAIEGTEAQERVIQNPQPAGHIKSLPRRRIADAST